MPTVDADALLKAYPASSNKYTLETMAGNYGCVEFDLKDLATSPTAYECKISTAGVNQFSLLAYNGAVYIDSIYVFCAK